MAPRVAAAVPAAPTNCYAVATSATATNATVEIGWIDNSTTETQWKIQYSTNNWATSTWLTLDASSTTITTKPISYPWSAAALNTAYRFRVVAVNASGSSVASNDATVGTFDLGAPTNFSATAVDPFNVTMKWDENSTGESGTAIECKVGTGAWSYLGAMGANSVSLVASCLLHPLDTFAFRIRVYKGGEPKTPDSAAGATAVSAYSQIFTLTTGAYTLTASPIPCTSSVLLAWPNILNESGYQILYKEASESSYSQYGLVDPDVTSYQVDLPATAATKTYFFIVRPYVGTNIVGESSEASALVDIPASITSKTGTSGTPGSPFSHTFVYVSDATVSSCTLTGIPDGLTFDNTTGLLSGVYPPLGNYTLNYAVHFTTGSTLTQTFYIRVRRPAGPPVVGTVIPAWTGMVGATRDTALAGTFTAPEADSAVRVSTTLGTMDFILYNTSTPATVTNFMTYVNEGKFTDVDFHRSIAGFVIQAGGFKGAGTGSNFTSVVTHPPVVNEPGIANVRGTVSMAKLGGNPNSATSQFFVSLADNRDNLDYQNGGFTAFGRVAGDGMTVADAISNLPNGTYNLNLDGSVTATQFDNFPMNAATLPAAMDQTKLVKMNSVTTIPTLSYAVTGNTDATIATASIVNGQLHLIGLAVGHTTISVTATDLDNLNTTQAVEVNLSDRIPATVTLGNLAATYNGTPKSATATTVPAGLAVSITYNGLTTAPTNVGSYAVVATVNDPNYQGSATGTLVISGIAAKVTLSGLTAIYNGAAKAATATTTPAGLVVNITYDGSASPPKNAGSYAVIATINNATYQGSATGTLVISKAAATVKLGNLTSSVYNGSAKSASATTTPVGLAVNITYNGASAAPVNAGSYAIVATINDTNYQGSITGTTVITKATATATLGSLAATYDGTAKSATATTTPAGRAVTFTYAASATPPTNVGSYAVIGTINDTNYQGKATGTLVISKATATAILGNLAAIYDGTAKPVTATTTPIGLPVTFTYNGSATVPKNAGTYAVIATINNANYHGTATGTLVISKAAAAVTLGGLAATYSGVAKAATATTTPAGLAVTFTYGGLAAAPKNVGSYAVVATINNANYQGGATGTLVISKGTATVKLGTLAVTYNGAAKPVTATTTPAGLTVNLTYGGSPTAPTDAGTYAVAATVNNPNYQGGTTGNLVISKATATVKLGNLTASYSGNPITPTATTTPVGLAVGFTYNGSATAPTNAGSYAIVATINEANYKGSITGSLVITKATATVTLGNLAATYDGTSKSATASTTPVGLAVGFTYNGSAAPPVNVGSYAVIGTINDVNYQGRATGTLVISKAVAGALAAMARSSGSIYQAGTPSSFAAWATALEEANGLAAGTIANQPDADCDHDGRSNMIEYAFGTSPVIANDPAPRMPVDCSTATRFVMRYQRDTALADLTFTAQASVDLESWTSPGETGAPSGFADTLISTSGTLETHEVTIPRDSCGNIFIRVRVTRP